MAPKASAQMKLQTLKRKAPPQSSGSQQQRKRQKTKDARTIASQTSSKAFKNGELNVDKFIKAHEFEIKALEEGMMRAKKGLSSRAFQNVPRDMRRRAASHNVKKVPKRLQRRAAKEITEDNTPTGAARRKKPSAKMRLRNDTARRLKALSSMVKGKQKANETKPGNAEKAKEPSDTIAVPVDAKPDSNPNPIKIEIRPLKKKKNKLDQPPKPKARFRKRQLNKTWMPTHLYHAKRAHMTPPLEPLWRFAIPLTPTTKSYRPTHRASSERGAVAWDVSYMSTIGLEGTETALGGLLRAMGFAVSDDSAEPRGKKLEMWTAGTRSWESWMFERNGWPRNAIAPVTVVWCARDKSNDTAEREEGAAELSANASKKNKRKIFLRVHPAAFLQLWKTVLEVAKVQKPIVSVEDLRFEIGSIDVTGPAATEALVGTLWPRESSTATGETPRQPAQMWKSLASLTNPSSLPPNALLGFDVSDPRLHHPPRTLEQDRTAEAQQKLLDFLASWPPDRTQASPAIFSRNARVAASRSLPSQKAINRRKSLADPGAYPPPLPTDPKVPILLLASRGPSSTTQQGCWTLLIPWKCVLPVWYSLMYYPISTGGNVRFGGLREKRQVVFEAGVPWFPGDFPGTKAGWAWEKDERAKRKREWEKRPKGRRVEWDSVKLNGGRKGEVGVGWACDWEFLHELIDKQYNEPEAEGKKKSDVKANGEKQGAEDADDGRRNRVVPDGEEKGGTEENGEKSAAPEETSRENVKTVGTNKTEQSHENGATSDPLFYYLSPSLAMTALTPNSHSSVQDLRKALLSVKITLLARGVPITCSRIYRLPTNDPPLRQRWLALIPDPKSKKTRAATLATKPVLGVSASSSESHEQLRDLAASLLEPPGARVGDQGHPEVPGEEDLIGFVTTGDFNLREGKGTGLANLAACRVLERREEEGMGKGKEGVMRARQDEQRLCIVREAGMGLGRLARWELV